MFVWTSIMWVLLYSESLTVKVPRLGDQVHFFAHKQNDSCQISFLESVHLLKRLQICKTDPL